MLNNIFRLREKYRLKLCTYARYLGKIIKVDRQMNIEAEEEDYLPTANIIFIKSIAWDVQLDLINLYIIGKNRYNLTNEFDIGNKRKILQKLWKKIIYIKKWKKLSYIEMLWITRYTKKNYLTQS